MKSVLRTPFFRALYVILGLSVVYFISSVLSALVLGYDMANFFKFAHISIIVNIAVICVVALITNLHKSAFRHASITELIKSSIVCVASLVCNLVFDIIPYGSEQEIATEHLGWCVVCFLFTFVFSSIFVCAYRMLCLVQAHFAVDQKQCKKALIIGAGSAGTMILREIQSTNKINIKAVGFIDDDPNKLNTYLLGVKVLGNTESIEKIAEETDASLIIIAIPTADGKTIKRITEKCINTKCEIKTLPGLYQLIDGQVSVSRLRNVDVNDLLGREPVKDSLAEVMDYIEDQVVLVTGGGGSIGSELCRQIAKHNPKKLIILDIYENNAYDIEQELKRTLPNLNLLTLIASVRDSGKMDDVFKTHRPDIVFHAAAHKHVPLMETSPNEAVKNNILGTYKVVKCADKYNVKKFVQISTDKAVNPTNIMGATKRVCEMIIQAYARRSNTCFVAVRFGNVLGSNGSVIPLFKKQIMEGGPVTVTHKDIIRYFMTIPEAVSLVLQAGASAQGGEIFVLDMGEQVKIYDLAINLIKLCGLEPHKDIEIKITGLRPGEKLYEERLMAEEGLTKTANDKISIGKPLDIDEDKLFATLDTLYNEAYGESDRMKELVKELVPTYKIDKR
ncbi:MAG: polysaccharide biosynthesis protein [Clostridia bacterium]|nr:polysaccharide biosynthesis protein [Clostridia bacterium]